MQHTKSNGNWILESDRGGLAEAAGGWFACFLLGGRRCGVCWPEHLSHSAEGRLRHAGFICPRSNTLPLIPLWFCFRLCGIGAVEADRLQFTHTYREGL